MRAEFRQAKGTDASELTRIAFAAKRALDYAAESQSRTLKVIADPNAEGFYRRLGFRRIGDCPSKPEGRRLPLLEANLPSGAASVGGDPGR